jgi:hypothetical protein
MSYEILVGDEAPVEGWSVCTVCLQVERSAAIGGKRWRCSDCGVDASNNTQRDLKTYLTDNSIETIEKNLNEWSQVKGVRAAYKMLRSARYKCLITLSKRLTQS